MKEKENALVFSCFLCAFGNCLTEQHRAHLAWCQPCPFQKLPADPSRSLHFSLSRHACHHMVGGRQTSCPPVTLSPRCLWAQPHARKPSSMLTVPPQACGEMGSHLLPPGQPQLASISHQEKVITRARLNFTQVWGISSYRKKSESAPAECCFQRSN